MSISINRVLYLTKERMFDKIYASGDIMERQILHVSDI